MRLHRDSIRLPLASLSLLVLLSGCSNSSPANGGSGSGNGGSGGGNGLASGGATSVYAIEGAATVGGTSSILQYPAGANGSVSPSASVTLPSGFLPESLAVDASGQAYVGGLYNAMQSEILVYAAGASSPSRTLTVASEGSLAVDSSGNIYQPGPGAIDIYGPTANGTVTPTRTITSTTTELSTGLTLNVAVDASGAVYVATSDINEETGEVLVFAAGASGNVSPTLTLSFTTVPFGVAIDHSGNVFVSENNTDAAAPATIAEFAAGASTPSKTITLSGTTPSLIGGVQVDSVGNVYAIMDTEVGSGQTATDSFSIVALAPSFSGNAAPTRQLTSTSLTDPLTPLAIK